MAYTVTIIGADGSVSAVDNYVYNQEYCTALIKAGLDGAYLEVVPNFDKYGNAPCVAFCDEEGKLKGLPLNPKATYLWYACLAPQPFVVDHLHGPIVIVTADDPADLQKL